MRALAKHGTSGRRVVLPYTQQSTKRIGEVKVMLKFYCKTWVTYHNFVDLKRIMMLQKDEPVKFLYFEGVGN